MSVPDSKTTEYETLPLTMMDGEDTECIQDSTDECFADMTTPRYTNEAYEIVKLTLPLTAGFFSDHLIEIIHLMFLGHLPSDQLGAASLAMLFANATGLCLIMGMMSGIETLSSQAYGAGQYKQMQVTLQRGIFLGFVLLIPIILLRYYSPDLLLALGVDADLAANAGRFLHIVSINLPFSVIIEALRRYALSLSQSDVVFYNTIVGVILSFIFDYTFINILGMKSEGVAWTFVVSTLCMMLHIIGYFIYHKKDLFLSLPFDFTWEAVLSDHSQYLSLSIPGTLSLAAEWIGLEAQTFIAAYDSISSLGAQALLFNLTLLIFMPSMALAMVASARVGQHLGSMRTRNAKFSAKVASTCSVLMNALIFLLIITLGRYLGRLFTSDEKVLYSMNQCIPLLALYCFFDGAQGSLAGILRGCGKQKIAFIINLFAYWVIALPLAYMLALKTSSHVDIDSKDGALKQGLGIQGQWMAMCLSSCLATIAMITTLLNLDWYQLSLFADSAANEEDAVDAIDATSASTGDSNGKANKNDGQLTTTTSTSTTSYGQDVEGGIMEDRTSMNSSSTGSSKNTIKNRKNKSRGDRNDVNNIQMQVAPLNARAKSESILTTPVFSFKTSSTKLKSNNTQQQQHQSPVEPTESTSLLP